MEHDTNICSRYLYNVTNFKYVRIMDLKCDIDDDMQLVYGIDALVQTNLLQFDFETSYSAFVNHSQFLEPTSTEQ